jgi:hypothetical protein
MNLPFNSTPISYKKSSTYSPDKNTTPIATSSISKSPHKQNLSPRKQPTTSSNQINNMYTVHNQ